MDRQKRIIDLKWSDIEDLKINLFSQTTRIWTFMARSTVYEQILQRTERGIRVEMGNVGGKRR